VPPFVFGPDAPQPGFECAPGQAQSRVHCICWDPEGNGNFRRGQLLEFRQDKHCALVVVEFVKQQLNLFGGLHVNLSLLWTYTRAHEQRLVSGYTRALPGSLVAIDFSHAQRDAEDPTLERASLFEVAEPPVHHNENILGCILEIRRGHSKAPQAAPHEIEVLLVNLDYVEFGSHGAGQLTHLARPGRLWLAGKRGRHIC
jgi:hypothetical protein